MNNKIKKQYPMKHLYRDSKYLNYQTETLTVFSPFTEIKYNFDRWLEKEANKRDTTYLKNKK